MRTKAQLEKWVNSIKQDLRRNPKYEKCTEDEINEMVMDAMFYGFKQGQMYRQELAIIAEILGFELSKEFMNDPHPDPITLK